MRPVTRGCVPDRVTSRAGELGSHELITFTEVRRDDEVVQPIGIIRNQEDFPSCVGQALAACIDAAAFGSRQYASAVGIWREARRRQGLIERIELGTRLEYAADGLVRRGWDPWTGQAEESSRDEAGIQDSLADELFADDKRDEQMLRFRIQFDRVDKTKKALADGFGVVMGIGTKSPFYALDRMSSTGIVTEVHLGGMENGHAVRIVGFGYTRETPVFFCQNSWGEAWGGCWLGGKGFRGGCFAMAAGVLDQAWDVHAVKVKA